MSGGLARSLFLVPAAGCCWCCACSSRISNDFKLFSVWNFCWIWSPVSCPWYPIPLATEDTRSSPPYKISRNDKYVTRYHDFFVSTNCFVSIGISNGQQRYRSILILDFHRSLKLHCITAFICEKHWADSREALSELYLQTGGPGWKTKTNWTSRWPLRYWKGVIANCASRPIALSLPNNNLVGMLMLHWQTSNEIVAYSFHISAYKSYLFLLHLTGFKIGISNFAGHIPWNMGHLSNLKLLDFGDNKLSGKFSFHWKLFSLHGSNYPYIPFALAILSLLNT